MKHQNKCNAPKESKDHRFSLFLVENGLVVEGTCICGKKWKTNWKPNWRIKE